MSHVRQIHHIKGTLLQSFGMFKTSIFDKNQQKFSFVRQEILKIIPDSLAKMIEANVNISFTSSEMILFHVDKEEYNWTQYAELAVVFELIDLSFRLHRFNDDEGDANLQIDGISRRNGARILLGDFLLTEASKRSLQFENMAIQGCIARFMRNLSEASLLLLNVNSIENNGGRALLPIALIRKLRVCVEAAISARYQIAGTSAATPARAIMHLFTALFMIRLEQGKTFASGGCRLTSDDVAEPDMELLPLSSSNFVLERRLSRAHIAQFAKPNGNVSTFRVRGEQNAPDR